MTRVMKSQDGTVLYLDDECSRLVEMENFIANHLYYQDKTL